MRKKLFGPLALGIALALSSCASTKKDAMTLEERFKQYDIDDDGKVSPAEYAETATRIIFIAFDENEDGYVTLAEWQDLEGKDSDVALFKSHDTNKDGKISLDEALATTKKKKSFSEDFPGIDTNHDGYVDLPEAKAYAAKIRAGMKKK
jgi:Ca2+-binding EF-hand superfamily protein